MIFHAHFSFPTHNPPDFPLFEHRAHSKAAPNFITPSNFLIFTLETAFLLLYFINSMAEQQLNIISYKSFTTVERAENILSLAAPSLVFQFNYPSIFYAHQSRCATHEISQRRRGSVCVLVHEKERRIVIIINECCVLFTSSLPFTKLSVVSSSGSFCARIF